MRPRRTRRPLVAATLVAALCSVAPAAWAQVDTATLRGTIVDATSNTPVSGMSVYIAGKEHRDVTGIDGRFRLTGLTQGSHILIIRRIGYLPRGFRFMLTENHMGQIDLGALSVEQQVTQLDEIIVEGRNGGGRLAGYFRRVENGFGDYITREDIEKRHPIRTTDLLRTVAGVDVVCRGSDCQVGLERQRRPPGQNVVGQAPGQDDATGLGAGQSLIARSRDAVASDIRAFTSSISGSSAFMCQMRYFIDGVPFEGSHGINGIAPDLIEGIEVYKGPAATPAQFAKHGGACGVIAIWTRRPSR